MDLEVARAHGHLEPAALSPGLGERPRHRRFAGPEEAQDPMRPRADALEHAAKRGCRHRV